MPLANVLAVIVDFRNLSVIKADVFYNAIKLSSPMGVVRNYVGLDTEADDIQRQRSAFQKFLFDGHLVYFTEKIHLVGN